MARETTGTSSEAPVTGAFLDSEAALRALLFPRIIEERMLLLIRQGKLSKWFSGYGQEAIAVGVTLALDSGDYILPSHRNLGVWTARGVPLRALLCQLMGKSGGFTEGRDRTFHFGLPEYHIIGMISHLAAMLPVACGLGLAAQLRKAGYTVAAFVGDGATREGDFHEALSLAAIWRLPVLFIVENNGYGLSTPTREAVPIEDIADAAVGYGIPGRIVDGNDLQAVFRATFAAAAHARRGEGPILLEMKTFRIRGHEEASGTRYVPPELIEQWTKRDPIELYLEGVISRGAWSRPAIEAIRSEVELEVETATQYALAQPDVSGTPDTGPARVFAVRRSNMRSSSAAGEEKRFIDAIRDGLEQAMEDDSSVILMGQDIGTYGGVFKATVGLKDRFGAARVRDTPIMESGVIGAALGLALEGFKPVVEMQYGDFVACGFNQIVNNLATTHYRWSSSVNVTIRLPFGGGIGAGPFHSQSMEAWFCHVPGLKVVVPATPGDAKGLLLASIEDPNPVLFFEHKQLYRSERGHVPRQIYDIPLGVARVARPGRDLTVVTYGVGVRWALEEADFQAERGQSIEVIDLRTLVPLDEEAVLTSIRRTNRVIILHEAQRTGGFGGELCARIAEIAFENLDAPPVRVAGADIPIPYAPALEGKVYSARARLRSAVERVLGY